MPASVVGGRNYYGDTGSNSEAPAGPQGSPGFEFCPIPPAALFVGPREAQEARIWGVLDHFSTGLDPDVAYGLLDGETSGPPLRLEHRSYSVLTMEKILLTTTGYHHWSKD